MSGIYLYDQIIEKDTGNDEVALVCQQCWNRDDVYGKHELKCSNKDCSYRAADINIKKSLLNCPMCGSINIKVGLDADVWYVKCRNCGLNNRFLFEKYKKEDIYDYWNKRV